ncbi:MAG: hypothetical protein Q8M03_09830 [Legionella sp.]|nr:hypothetical protein [Legionella sp.]
MTSNRDPQQILLLSRVQTIKTEKIKQQIAQINDAIRKKELTIQQFEHYAQTYDELLGATLLQVHVLKNNEAFHHNLMRVINAEKSDLNRLAAMKKQLLSSYVQSANRADGFDSLHADLVHEKMQHRTKVHEEEINDLGNTLKGLKKLWNH